MEVAFNDNNSHLFYFSNEYSAVASQIEGKKG